MGGGLCAGMGKFLTLNDCPGPVMVAAGLGPTVTTFVAPPLPADAADHVQACAKGQSKK